MLESLFRLLFNYRPVIFQQGEFRLVPSAGSYVAAAVVAVRHCGDVPDVSRREIEERDAASRRAGGDADGHPAARLFCLFRPVLVVKAAVPQQNFLGVLIDDSRSMQIADWNQAPRANFVRQTFATPDAALLKALSDRFVIRTFRFSSVGLAGRRVRRSDVRRRPDAYRRRRSMARARSSPGCRSPASWS